MLLEFEQVSYTYPGSQQPAIANLTLSIPAGKRCALIGQNGCGKTTLFQMACTNRSKESCGGKASHCAMIANL
jgi:ABC-type bacteriocin/lantibiotic exporter with double-glycine peptidase domain